MRFCNAMSTLIFALDHSRTIDWRTCFARQVWSRLLNRSFAELRDLEWLHVVSPGFYRSIRTRVRGIAPRAPRSPTLQ